MLAKLLKHCLLPLAIFLISATPLWAQGAGADEESANWVLQFVMIFAFLILAMAILLWPTKRDDTVFSFDEQQEMRAEQKR